MKKRLLVFSVVLMLIPMISEICLNFGIVKEYAQNDWRRNVYGILYAAGGLILLGPTVIAIWRQKTSL